MMAAVAVSPGCAPDVVPVLVALASNVLQGALGWVVTTPETMTVVLPFELIHGARMSANVFTASCGA